MELHFWLLPMLAVGAIGLTIFYLVIRHAGGFGERTDGRVVSDQPTEEETPPSDWNVYG